MNGLRIGLWGCRGDDRGLHRQMVTYSRYLAPVRAWGFDLTRDGDSPYPCDWSDYDGIDLTVTGRFDVTPEQAAAWLTGLDWAICAETTYQDWLPDVAREVGVKTLVVVNPELNLWHSVPDLPRPDVFAVPTTWLQERLPGAVLLPTPIDEARLPWQQRRPSGPLKVLHVAGHPAAWDRAGTVTVLHAARLAKVPMTVTIAAMQWSRPRDWKRDGVEVRWQVGVRDDPWGIFYDHDVLLAPKRYSGQDLTVVPASASGMPVIYTDVEPQSSWGLPGIGVRSVRQRTVQTQGGPVVVHDADARAVAGALTRLARDQQLVADLSAETVRVRAEWSWETVGPLWQRVLTGRGRIG